MPSPLRWQSSGNNCLFEAQFREQIQPCSYITIFGIPIKLLINVNVAYCVGKSKVCYTLMWVYRGIYYTIT